MVFLLFRISFFLFLTHCADGPLFWTSCTNPRCRRSDRFVQAGCDAPGLNHAHRIPPSGGGCGLGSPGQSPAAPPPNPPWVGRYRGSWVCGHQRRQPLCGLSPLGVVKGRTAVAMPSRASASVVPCGSSFSRFCVVQARGPKLQMSAT